MNEVALKLFHVLKTFGFHAGLAVGTFAPGCLTGLVATDIDIFRGEQFNNFVEHVLQEFERGFLAGAEVA